jgi:hypothetical protein
MGKGETGEIVGSVSGTATAVDPFYDPFGK